MQNNLEIPNSYLILIKSQSRSFPRVEIFLAVFQGFYAILIPEHALHKLIHWNTNLCFVFFIYVRNIQLVYESVINLSIKCYYYNYEFFKYLKHETKTNFTENANFSWSKLQVSN